MRNPANARRDHQLNIRFTSAELEALERIALAEDRDRSYLVTWFTRWGMEHYRHIGSLMAMRSTKIVSTSQFVLQQETETQSHKRLGLRSAASEKLREASEHNQINTNGSARRTEKRKRA